MPFQQTLSWATAAVPTSVLFQTVLLNDRWHLCDIVFPIGNGAHVESALSGRVDSSFWTLISLSLSYLVSWRKSVLCTHVRWLSGSSSRLQMPHHKFRFSIWWLLQIHCDACIQILWPRYLKQFLGVILFFQYLLTNENHRRRILIPCTQIIVFLNSCTVLYIDLRVRHRCIVRRDVSESGYFLLCDMNSGIVLHENILAGCLGFLSHDSLLECQVSN